MTVTVDTLIYPGWIVPVTPRGEVLTERALAIREGRIEAIVDFETARAMRARETVELPGHVLLPGLINMHGHAAMSLLRGYADDYALSPWLKERIWPVESRVVGPEFVRDGVDLAIAEMLRSGTTCFGDMYFFPDVTAERARRAGIRAQICFPVLEFPSAWAKDADEYIGKGLSLRDDLKQSELVAMAFGPHAPYTVGEATLRKISVLASELDLPVQIHLHETAGETAEAELATGRRPIAALDELGLIGPRTQCVHMTDLTDGEIDLLATKGAHVVHCPDSNMKLGSGRCPVHRLLQAGVNVALGTDGAASNNDLSLLGEMRGAALLAKVGERDATRLPAASVLEMATLRGALAMGLQDRLGSLEVGKLADVIAVDLAHPQTQPVYDPISQLVYAADGSQVTHGWVGGRPVLRDRQLAHMDLDDILDRARDWGERIAKERTAA